MMAAYERAAKECEWLVFHNLYAVGSDFGYPDLVMLRDEYQVAAELKSEKGRLTPEQQAWLTAYAGVGAIACLWRPSMLQEIYEFLAQPHWNPPPGLRLRLVRESGTVMDDPYRLKVGRPHD